MSVGGTSKSTFVRAHHGDHDAGEEGLLPTVGAYYYPWYGKHFHNGGGYLRKKLEPPQQPTLGEYDDTKSDVIQQHLDWSRQANVRVWVTSWWGPNRLEDSTTRDVILEHPNLGDHRIALHYETTNRIKNGDVATNVRSDVQYLCERYFHHPNYYRIKGRPVLVIYLSRKLCRDGLLESVLLIMRSEASRHGHNLYLIGDQVFQKAPSVDAKMSPYPPFWYLDAVTNYDVYGSNGRPEGYVGRDQVDRYYSEQGKWRELAMKEGCGYIPAVSPGYNDRGVRLQDDHPPLSRRLTANGKEGSLFWYQLKRAMPLVDHLRTDGLLLVNSFNEWHEDTQIEPVAATVGSCNDASTTTSKPVLLTKSLEYTAYGDLYLNILAAVTTTPATSTSDATQKNSFDYQYAES